MRKTRRLSDEAAVVLRLFVADSDSRIYGREIVRSTGIRSGSLYPILHRLEAQKLLQADWEELSSAVEDGVRPRRFYRLDPNGADRARAALAEWQAQREADTTPFVTRPATS